VSKTIGDLSMRASNCAVLILLASIFTGWTTSCSLVGVNDSMLVGITQVIDGPTSSPGINPLLIPQTDVVIKSTNASLLAPSDVVIIPESSGLTWLQNNQGIALAKQEEVLLLHGSQAGINAQSSAPEMAQTITSTLPSLLTAANGSAIIAWVSEGGTINTLDVSSDLSNPITVQAESPVTGLALSPSGDKLAYVSFNSRIKVQGVGDSRVDQTWTLPNWLVNLMFSPDGSQLAGADLANFTLYFLNASTGEVINKQEWLDSVTPALYGIYLSPDWKQAAWVAQNVVQIKDIKDDSNGPLLIHQDVVRSVSWSPDGRLLATGSAALLTDRLEPAVMIWDVSSGQLLNILVQQVAVQSVAFSPDGRQLAVLDTNGNLKTWSASP
jgi:WD40 repeat protein